MPGILWVAWPASTAGATPKTGSEILDGEKAPKAIQASRCGSCGTCGPDVSIFEPFASNSIGLGNEHRAHLWTAAILSP